jgi:hypothetical protein
LIAKVKKIGWDIIGQLHYVFKNKEMIKIVLLFYWFLFIGINVLQASKNTPFVLLSSQKCPSQLCIRKFF